MKRALRNLLPTIVLIALAAAPTAVIAAPGPVSGGNPEWRSLRDTVNISWNQAAAVCPRDGATPCTGAIGTKDVTGWIWATDARVVDVLGYYEPRLLTVTPPSLSGPEYLVTALGFDGDIGSTFEFNTTYSHSEGAFGWTSSGSADAPHGGGAAGSWPPFNGSFGVGAGGTADESTSTRGLWLWRDSSLDHTAPVITPVVQGTEGNDGWYVSNVSVSWSVQDDRSPIDSKVGCGSATVTADVLSRSFSCQATSVGGTASSTVNVKRDATSPSVRCGSTAPIFEIYQFGALVPASVSDATSGPLASSVRGYADTSTAGTFSATVVGTDHAGNTTTRSCPYSVVIPTCRGLAPTILGTGNNDTISGTIGRDIILALGGADTINGDGGNDVICGNDGPDTISGGGGKDVIDGGASNDSIYGGAGDDNLDGGAQIDSLRGDSG